MTVQVNGAAFADEFLGKNLQFYTLITTVNIVPTGLVAPFHELTQSAFPITSRVGTVFDGTDGDAYTQEWLQQQMFGKTLEVVGLRGQAVILGQPSVASSVDITTVGGLLTGSTGSLDLYVLRFALEHEAAWRLESETGATVDEVLSHALNGVGIGENNGSNELVVTAEKPRTTNGVYGHPEFTYPTLDATDWRYVSVPGGTANNVVFRRSETLPLDVDFAG